MFKFFTKKRSGSISTPINNAKSSRHQKSTHRSDDADQNCDLDTGLLDNPISPLQKIKTFFSSKESLLSSRESLLSSRDSLADTGVAYRRHPDDKRSAFGRPKSTSTSVACYGRYSMYELDTIDPVQENLINDISISLVSLERIESIQKRSYDIARNRRQYQRNKDNKRRKFTEDELQRRSLVTQSMIELPVQEITIDDDMVTIEIRAASPIVARKSSIQKKSWEIRRQRKMRMKKRRSEFYEGEFYPLIEDSLGYV